MSFSKNRALKTGAEYSSFIILFTMAASSYYNGWDTYTYKRYFDFIVTQGFEGVPYLSSVGIEIGFSLLMFLVSLVSKEFQVFLAVVSFISSFLIFHGVRKVGFQYRFFAILYFASFFLPLQLSTIRQGLAVAIMVYAMNAVIRHQSLKFMISVAIAMMFHYSAVITIPFYFFYHIDLSKKQGGLIALVAIPFWYISSNLSPLLISVLDLGVFGKHHFVKQIMMYFLNSTKTGFPPILLYSLLLFGSFYLFVYNSKIESHRFTFKLYLFLILIQFYSRFLPGTVVVRLEYYFIFAQLFVYCLMIQKAIIQRNSLAVVAGLTLVPLFCLVVTVRNQFYRKAFLPYHSYWGYHLFNIAPRTDVDIGHLAKQYNK